MTFWSLIKTSQSSLFRSAVTIPVISPLGSTPPIISPPKTLQYGHEEDTREERENLPERPWKSFPALYHRACLTGNMVQKISGRVSLARPVLCWAHITFKPLLRRLRMKSLVTIASHTHVLWASSRGDGTRDQAKTEVRSTLVTCCLVGVFMA